jgi:predicted alpha/beta hydrolase
MGLLERPEQVDAMVAVSSQSGYWRVQGDGERLRALVMVAAVLPAVSRLLGYFPWSKLARGEDLPGGVAIEWAGWCRRRRYLLDDPTLPVERYAGFRAPILAYSIDDDGWGTARSVDEMMSVYPDVERRHLVPAEHSLKKIGHMGYFRPTAAALWPIARDWLDRAATDHTRGPSSASRAC